MFITVSVIAYNEENTIPSLLEDIKKQDYDHSKMEVVLVDSASSDGTKKVLEKFKEQAMENGFRAVKVLDNPKRTAPCGWNVVLQSYEGEAVIRVDAHASIPSDFVSKNVALLESGESVCGGQRPNMIYKPTPWKETLLMAESSMFGSSIAPYRNNPGKSYVKSMFHAAYKREVFDKVGGFNEKLARTEDNEMHYRIREAGFKLCFDPEIISYQHTRSSLVKMLKQKFSNGYWIGLTAGVCPKCLSIYHFVPFAFVVAIIISTIACIILPQTTLAGSVIYGLTGCMWGMYWILAVLMSIVGLVSSQLGADELQPDAQNGRNTRKNWTCTLLPFLFFLLHISYGIGTLAGLVKMPFWRRNNKL